MVRFPMGCTARRCGSYRRALSVIQDISLLLQRQWKETQLPALSLSSFFKVWILTQHVQFSFSPIARPGRAQQPGKPALRCLRS